MAQPYLRELTAIIGRLDPATLPALDLSCRHFFSGAALYVDDRICLTLTPAGLALKLPEADRTALLAAGDGEPLRYFPKAPIKREYLVLAGAIVGDDQALHALIGSSIDYVRRSP